MESRDNLSNFIKYCLGYINLTRRQGLSVGRKEAVVVPEEYLSLEHLLDGDLDGNMGEVISLETFHQYAPKDVPEEMRGAYKLEKQLAEKIENIYNKHRNDQFRKQVLLQFGFFEVELPVEEGVAPAGDDEQSVQSQLPLMPEEPKIKEPKREKYPIFTIPVRIEKDDDGKYVLYTVDTEFQVNTGGLEAILDESSYYQLLEEIGKYEMGERLTLPLSNLEIFREIWEKIESYLKLGDAVFDGDSFKLNEMNLVLSAKANFFLSEDLRKLFEFSEDELKGTALATWINNDGLASSDESDEEESSSGLYFPFSYDKYQLRILSLLKNKAFIVEGPPGTGKSQTISNLLCHLAASGKKVLFVSQKAQALKVVKDKLKSLNIDYLFGYVPNPASNQLSEIDEFDGIAPQLLAMSSHVSKLQDGSYDGLRKREPISLESAAEKAVRLTKNINESIGVQREVVRLNEELVSLNEYEMSITDLDAFKESFGDSNWKQIVALKKRIETLVEGLKRYSASESKKDMDGVFADLDFDDAKYSSAIRAIKEDVSQTAYDRHSKVVRTINTTARNLRLRKERAALPREIIDYIDEKLKSDISRREAVDILSPLLDYCEFFEVKKLLEEDREKLEVSLNKCGVSKEEFQIISDMISETSSEKLEEIKGKIVRVQEIKSELEKLQIEDSQEYSKQLTDLLGASDKRVAIYIQNILNKNIFDKSKSVAVIQKIRRLAKSLGKSKTAFKTFDRLRRDPDNFDTILDLIPIWIMELDDASRIIPLEAGIFDYVILDEASQCNVAYTLPVMFRSKQAIFVGDSEQMRDSTIMFKANKSFDELARRYRIPEELQIKSTGETVQSVLDIAYLRGFQSRTLTYHYRSPKELIGFSNNYFYTPKGKELISLNSHYLTYKDTNRIMLVHEVEVDWGQEISDSSNIAEAKRILELFRELRSDERYKDKSIGILTFFNAQASCIRDLFESEGLKEEDDNYVVSIIDGIQGDEKDIIIYSFVIKKPEQKRMYQPLTGEGGDVQRDINMGRVNVAFSRARLQVHCFTSIPVDEFPENIWIKKFLQYAGENGEIDFYSTDLKPFDSYFEEEFYSVIRSGLGKGYIIQNQVGSCGFKIDFVATNTKNGKRIAIECDGPTHFKDELDEELGIYVESDYERQAVLEASGWKFYRLRYSDWVDEKFEKENVVSDIKKLLI